MSRKVKVILLSIGIILLGFLREYLFKNINWIYLTLTNGRMNGARSEFNFLLSWSPSEINTLKTVLTLVFIVSFTALSAWILRTAFRTRDYDRLIIFIFLGMSGAALIIAGLGYITGTLGSLYGIVRTLIGLCQSFIPVMVLGIFIRFLMEHTSSEDK